MPVISYDRLITDADVDYYISFDNEQVGKLQGEASSRSSGRRQAKGRIVMINGAPTDNNAKLFKQGAHSVIDSSGFKVAKEYDTPDWSPDKAQQEMEQAITALGKNGFEGVYAANDGTAGGAIAAMKGAGIDPKTRPTTGQDAELAAIQRILAGEQYMTVYKAIKAEAEAAAELAVALAKGKTPPAADDKIDNGTKQVPSILLTPVAVTKDNVNDTIIKDGFWTADEICTAQVRGRLQGSWHPVGRCGEDWGRPAWGAPSLISGRSRMNSNGSTPVLALKGVSKSFGPVQALSDVDFEVAARRGRGARRRQRRRQVHAGQGDRRDPPG